MTTIPRAWAGATPARLITLQLHRFGLHPGGTWSVAWVALFAAGALQNAPEAPWALVGSAMLGAAFSGLTLVGALAFAGRPAPLWILPALIALGLVRGFLWLAFGPEMGRGVSLVYEPAAPVAAAYIVFCAPLLASLPVTRWALLLSFLAVAGIEAADALVPLLAEPFETRLAWYVVAPVAAFTQICAMWAWIARREVRLERAEDEQRELEDEVARERRTSELLRRKEAWLFDFFERAPDMLVVLAPETSEILRCNRRFSETLGHARKDLVGRPLLEFVDPATLATAGAALTHPHRRLRNAPLRLLRHDGTGLSVLANLALRSDAEGHEEMRGVLHDVTGVRVRRGDEGDALYRMLTTQVSVGIFRVDPEGRCLFVNPSFCELSGLAPDRAHDHGWLPCVHSDDRRRVEDAFRGAVRERVSFRLEHRVTPRAGVVHRVLTEGVPEAGGAAFVASMVLVDGPRPSLRGGDGAHAGGRQPRPS